MVQHPQVYLDVAVGSNLSGRIVIEFFNNSSQLLIENFISLCSSSSAAGPAPGSAKSASGASSLGSSGNWTVVRGRPKLLTYKNCSVFRVVKGEYLECGDIVNNDGTGFQFDRCFKDYPNTRSHSQAGLVTVVNYRGYQGGAGITSSNAAHSSADSDSAFPTNSFGSQFCILFGSVRYLDGRYSVIGRVVSGMEFVRAIENVPVHLNNSPRMEVALIGCGLLERLEARLESKQVAAQRKLLEELMGSATDGPSASASLYPDLSSSAASPSHAEPYEDFRCVYSGRVKTKRKPDPESSNTLGKRLLAEALQGISHHYVPLSPTAEPLTSNPAPDALPGEEPPETHVPKGDQETLEPEEPEQEELDPIALRLKQLSGKLNECSRLNKNEVILEDKLKANPRLARSMNSRLLSGSAATSQDGASTASVAAAATEAAPSGLATESVASQPSESSDESAGLNIRLTKELNMPASVVERMDKIERTKSKNKSFGWNVFNQDALYRAHKKRVRETGFNHVLYEKQKQQLGEAFYEPTIVNHEASETSKDLIVRNVEKQYKKRDQFSRRRLYDDEAQDISYINERNRVFNKKLERSFGAYSEEIKRNLERGTAL